MTPWRKMAEQREQYLAQEWARQARQEELLREQAAQIATLTQRVAALDRLVAIQRTRIARLRQQLEERSRE